MRFAKSCHRVETFNIRLAGAGDPLLGRRETLLGVKPSRWWSISVDSPYVMAG